MSKNFELLSRASWRQDYFEGLPVSSAPSADSTVRETFRPRTRNSVLNDPISSLVHKVFLEPKTGQPRIVAFAGISRNVGCTWTCVHVAKALAKYVDGKVCLVDANLEAPAVHQYFSGNPSAGISDAILESLPLSRFAVKTQEMNLWYLPAGNHCKRILTSREGAPVESQQLRVLAKDFDYDYVLVDAPAVVSGALATEICRASEGTVLVLEPSETTATTLAKGKAVLASKQVRLLGVVLNRRVRTMSPVLDRLIR
jgi:Mrp family chromosome partitioning ATPase